MDSLHIFALPEELLSTTCSFLDASDLRNLSETCTTLRYISTTSRLWTPLLKKSLGLDSEHSSSKHISRDSSDAEVEVEEKEESEHPKGFKEDALFKNPAPSFNNNYFLNYHNPSAASTESNEFLMRIHAIVTSQAEAKKAERFVDMSPTRSSTANPHPLAAAAARLIKTQNRV